MHDSVVTTEPQVHSGRVWTFSHRTLCNAALYVVYVLLFSVALRLINPIMLRYDDGWILLVSYSWLNGFGFTNFWVSAISSTVFNWHGFVQPVLVATLAPCATLTCVNIGLVILGVVYLAVWYATVSAVTDSQPLRWILYVIGVSSVLQFSARPELVAALVLVLITMVYLRMTDMRRFGLRAALAGGLVGLAAMTNPTAGVFAGLGVAAATAYLRRSDASPIGLVAEGSIAVAAALFASVLLLVVVYPLDAVTWLEGIYEHVVSRSKQESTPEFVKFYFMTKLFPLQIALFIPLAALAAGGLKSVWAGGNRLSLVIFLIASLCFAWFVYYSAIRIPPRFYYFSQLAPAIALIAIRLATTVRYRQSLRLTVFAFPIALFALACGASQLVLVAQKAHAAPDHDRMMAHVAETVDRYLAEGRRIAMDPPLAAAVDDSDKLRRIELLFGVDVGGSKGTEELEERQIDVLLRAQTETGPLPDDVPGFRLVDDNFQHSSITRFLKPMGLYFAVYEAEPGKQ